LPKTLQLEVRSNPYNPQTRIAYALPSAGQVRLEIFDVRGRLLTTLVDGHCDPGEYTVTWRGTNDRGQPVASGVYLARLATGTKQLTQKLVIAR
jgi:flagellar hook assembly protein FlgD